VPNQTTQTTPPSPPWYDDGLRFSCTQCGNCCSGEPGFTWINEDEITALAVRVGVDRVTFLKRYTKTAWRDGEKRVSLTEKPGGDCVFFQRGSGCSVYTERPKQCRTWPFWRRIVRSKADWDDSAQECPGMNQGQLHDAQAISASAADDGL
jgi:Fe-S-cluster containining protein